MMSARLLPLWSRGIVVLLLVGGCGPDPQVERFSIPKPIPPDQMLAAMVWRDGSAWFYKVTGPNAAVREQAEAIEKFVGEVRYDPSTGQPTWDSPPGWRTRFATPGDIRYATVEIETSGAPLTLSVIQLPLPAGAETRDFELSNVNRWRGQMGLPAVDLAQLDNVVTRRKFGDAESIVVRIEGRLAEPTAGGPMSGMAGGGMASGGLGPAEPTEPPPSPIRYRAPADWEPRPLKPFSVATFGIPGDGDEATVTVSQVGGGLSENYNRWRDQVGLPRLDNAAVAAEFSAVPLAEGEGMYTRLSAGEEDQALWISVALIEHDGEDWYVRMSGPRSVCAPQEEAFRAFLGTIRFSEGE